MRPTAQESRWIGRVLRDKWRIDRRIARGGMGTVFAATHRNNGMAAAIKVLHPEFSRDDDTRSRFLQEGYAANQVNHPGVVRILDDDVTEEGFAFLVMELLEGELLEQRRIRKGGRIALPEMYEFADQLLDVLAAAHAAGIVHRDVKPDNIFLTQQGRLKVLDFGFAQIKNARREQTATGLLLGTPGFMAPEQAAGKRRLIDAQTDVWAVGATLHLCLSGQPVHAGDSPAEILLAAASFPVKSIANLEPHLPTKLVQVIDCALAYKKQDRWPDARSMQAALRAVPGRTTPSDPMRRSIPDVFERPPSILGRDPRLDGDEVTVMEHFEELVDVDLKERSGETVAIEERHPAEDEKPTLAREPDGATLEQMVPDDFRTTEPDPGALRRHLPFQNTMPMTASLLRPESATDETGIPNIFHDDPPVDGTVVMESRPALPVLTPEMISGSSDASGLPPTRPERAELPSLLPSAQPSVNSSGPFSHLGPHPMHSLAPGQTKLPAPGGASRVLLFLLVAGITMVVVILTGLLVILGSE